MFYEQAPWYGAIFFIAFAVAISIFALWKAGKLRDLFNEYPSADKVAENIANALDKAQKDLLAQYQRSLKDAQDLIEELKKVIDDLRKKLGK